MSHPKERHYWTQLRTALTAGDWKSPAPAKDPGGTPLSWSELFRKFNKHCKGYQKVADVASQIHALSLLLAAGSRDDPARDNKEPEVFPLLLARECMLPEERIEEATAGYKVLKDLEPANLNTVTLSLAFYAYALGNFSECLSHLERVSDVVDVQSHIPTIGTTRSSTTTLLTPHTAVTFLSSSSGSGSFASVADNSLSEIKDGRAWAMTEAFRSICLQGMSREKLVPSDRRKALQSYHTASPLFSILKSEFATTSTPQSTGKLDFTPFRQLRELWSWVERLLWRAVVLSSSTVDVYKDGEDDSDSLWTWLGHYASCSVSWPSNFRTAHRSTISSLHFRALILRHGNTHPNSVLHNKSPLWAHTARSAIQDYRAILSVSTKFPRAGERNVKVEEFVDLCVAIWETSGSVGEHAGWLIDVLWWATRLTFNSSRVIRHMTRLLHLSGDTPLAKRMLRLYVQVVGKAWQASKAGIGEDADTDNNWVETLVFGARMLCRHASTLLGSEGIDDVREAGKLVEKARARLDRDKIRLLAEVELADGIWRSVLAAKEQDPYTRPQHLAEAHKHLLLSVETCPTPGGYYHLALSYSYAGPFQDLQQAIAYSGLSIEGDPKDVRHWHLLGLLLTTSEKWKEAAEILEHGAEIDSVSSATGDDARTLTPFGNSQVDIRTISQSDTAGQVQDTDLVAQPSNGDTGADQATVNREKSVYALEHNAVGIPSASGLLKTMLDRCVPSRQDAFESALQLRMTQVALTEIMEGAEGAEQKWLEIFSWIAEKKGASNDALPRPSTEIPRTFMAEGNTNTFSEASHYHDPEKTPKISQITNGADPAVSNPTTNEDHPQFSFNVTPADPEPTRTSEDTDTRSSITSKSKPPGYRSKRSSSIDRDTSKSKKVQQMLKNRVHKGQARITAVSRKIGHGVTKNGPLRRSNSTPDFHAVLQQTSFQASSIHSRKRLSSLIYSDDRTPTDSPPPPAPPILPAAQDINRKNRSSRENRLLSNSWLMSAATFRRLGKIEQTKAAIQEAEVRDEDNPAVWVQLGLYYVALGHHQHAIDSFQKALFINPDDVSAVVHLSRLYLSPESDRESKSHKPIDPNNIDLAAGLLTHLTRGVGWDVPEAWYYLAKAYGLQGRRDREQKSLTFALELSEHRGVREIGAALNYCI